jgi:hypothetical protein
MPDGDDEEWMKYSRDKIYREQGMFPSTLRGHPPSYGASVGSQLESYIKGSYAYDPTPGQESAEIASRFDEAGSHTGSLTLLGGSAGATFQIAKYNGIVGQPINAVIVPISVKAGQSMTIGTDLLPDANHQSKYIITLTSTGGGASVIPVDYVVTKTTPGENPVSIHYGNDKNAAYAAYNAIVSGDPAGHGYNSVTLEDWGTTPHIPMNSWKGTPTKCPAGQHWDPDQKKCVLDIVIPTGGPYRVWTKSDAGWGQSGAFSDLNEAKANWASMKATYPNRNSKITDDSGKMADLTYEGTHQYNPNDLYSDNPATNASLNYQLKKNGYAIFPIVSSSTVDAILQADTYVIKNPLRPGDKFELTQNSAPTVVLKTYEYGVGVMPSGHCFIATAAFGTPMAPEIDALRRFRDTKLSTNATGRAMVKTYYAVSPPIAKGIARSPRMKAVVRALLKPIVDHLNN